MSVQLAKNVDVNKLKYSEVKTLASGAKSVYINYGPEKLTIQTPVMSLPYGIGEPFENKELTKSSVPVEKDKKYDLTLSFRGFDENPKIKSFHDKLKEIETKIIEDGVINRLAWFKDDDVNEKMSAKMFTPIIKVDKDPTTGKVVGKYPPTFKAKLPYDIKTDKFAFDSYDMDNNEVDFLSIMKKLKGAKVQAIIQLTGIWFAGGRYGCSWKFVSGKFQLFQSYKMTFIEDSDTEKIEKEEEEEEEDDLSVDTDTLKTLQVAPDEEDEEEEDDDTPPPPVPPPKKAAGGRTRK